VCVCVCVFGTAAGRQRGSIQIMSTTIR
jgi:hypothetical protein